MVEQKTDKTSAGHDTAAAGSAEAIADRSTARRRHARRFYTQQWIESATTLVSLTLCGGILYLMLGPLPKPPKPEGHGQAMAFKALADRASVPMDTYTRVLKTRDLFKPSMAIPAENKVAKTTAQQLADRLKFMGTTPKPDGLRAFVMIPNQGPAMFKVGDRVAEFTLEEVKADSLVLKLEEERVTVKR